MSQDKILDTLESIGLNPSDAHIYVYLGKKGPQRARDISAVLKIPKNLLYISLKNLQAKGILNASLEKPSRFSAEPFEKVLDMFVRSKMEEVKKIENYKLEILSEWKSLAVGIDPEKIAKFTVLEGKNAIYSRLKNMVNETKQEMRLISSVQGLMRVEQFYLFDLFKPKTHVKFLTEIREKDIRIFESLLDQKRSFKLEGRVPEMGLRLFTRIVIRDNEDAAFFLTNDEDKYNQESDVCLWTNCKALVDSFVGVFENLWVTSTDIEQKLLQYKKGDHPLKTSLIPDSHEAQALFNKAIKLAQHDIVMIASAEILDYEMSKESIEEKANDGVSIRIMLPITSNSYSLAYKLSEYCEVRHVPPSYLDTTLIDGKSFFQFKSHFSLQNVEEYFRNATFVEDQTHVDKTKEMMENIWNCAYAPLFLKPQTSATNKREIDWKIEGKRDKSYSRVFNFVEKPSILSTISEKEILNRILNAKRYSTRNCLEKGIIIYGSVAQTFIRPSEGFDLPEMMIQVFNNKSQSSFGSTIMLIICLKTVTSQGFSFVSTVAVHTNEGLAEFIRNVNKGAILEKNINIFIKGEIEVREQSNTLFVGWTKPIPLTGNKVLPPSGLLFEGYGEVRTNVAKIAISNGWQVLTEGNSLEAFTTFYHSPSKYSRPGTDGLFFRDHIMTYLPPPKSIDS